MAKCIRPGCSRVSWNGSEAEFCGKSCKAKGPVAGSSTGMWLCQMHGDSESGIAWEALGGEKDTIDIDAALCAKNAGGPSKVTISGGREVDLNMLTIAVHHQNLKPRFRRNEATCIRPLCERLSYNRQPNEFCGHACSVKGPCLCPLRRTGPACIPASLHPLYMAQVRAKEHATKDWLTNDFFWRAFQMAVEKSL